jgi:hypothetical protein
MPTKTEYVEGVGDAWLSKVFSSSNFGVRLRAADKDNSRSLNKAEDVTADGAYAAAWVVGPVCSSESLTKRTVQMTDARTTTEETALTTAGIEAYVTSLSNWGRWGDDDRIGTLKLITDEVRVAAAATIRTGRAVSLSRPIDSLDPDPVDSGFALVQRFMTLNEVADHAGRELRYEALTEYVGIGAHGSNTHIDGLAHYSWDGKNYIADLWQLSGLLPTEIQTSVVPLAKPTGN